MSDNRRTAGAEMTQEISLAEGLKMWRSKLGLTQIAMAKHLGISREHYSKIESGRHRNPRLSSIWKFLHEGCGICATVTCTGTNDHFHIELAGEKENLR